MIIFIYGQDSYRSKEKLDEIVAHYKEVRKSGLNLAYIDAKEADMAEVLNHFKVSSMFAETKLIILKNVFSNKKFQEDFLAEIKTMQALKDVVVVYENEAPDARLKLFKTLLKECKSQEFDVLDTKNIKVWAQAEFQKRQAKVHPVKSAESSVEPRAQQFNRINNDALDLLTSYVGSDLWRFSNEIEKLVNLKRDGVIQKADVQLMVAASIENDIFKTIDALAEKDKRQALTLIHKHLSGEDNPLYLFSMIAYQFRNLLMVKELSEKGMMYASIVKKSGLHPFVVKKTYFQCRQFSFAELKKIYQNIFAIDSDIKIGKIEAETALDLFVSKL